MFKRLALPALASVAIASIPTPSRAAITLFDKDGLSFTTGGFVEMDADFDTTRTFDEVVGNKAVAIGANGASGRQTFSIRNSRMFFQTDYKPADSGWATRGYFEFDLLGFDPSSTSLSSTGQTTEAGFFNNPTFRVRHAYIQATKDDWMALAGQYWELFGWQPYYFMSSVDVQPIPAMVYTRTTQFRALKSCDLSESMHVQSAVAALRAPQRDAGLPDFQAGIRITDTNLQAASGLGSSGKLANQPLSLGISGLYRQFVINSTDGTQGDLTHFPALALSVNTFVPLLPSTNDNLSSLAFIGAFTTGRGYGDQFSGWTGGTASNLNIASNGVAATQKPNLDGGIGDYDANGTFHLINLLTYNLNLQYTLPIETPTWVDIGYGRLFSNNMYQLVGTNGLGSSDGPTYNAESDIFGNVFRDLNPHVRVGLEFLRVRTDYTSGNVAYDNRYQFSTFFLF